MKRISVSGNNHFARSGINAHYVRTMHTYRGGVRR